uniref:(northern house mosquito) hypothetical protein n=1 Tax=Culex pipiens TaxID=7175 RepID=A0A8D8C2L3_CULPI
MRPGASTASAGCPSGPTWPRWFATNLPDPCALVTWTVSARRRSARGSASKSIPRCGCTHVGHPEALKRCNRTSWRIPWTTCRSTCSIHPATIVIVTRLCSAGTSRVQCLRLKMC